MLGGMTTSHRTTAAVLCVLVLGAGASACSKDDGSTSSSGGGSSASPSGGATPAVCADLSALRASADKIKASKGGQGSLNTLTTELNAMQATVKKLSDDAATQYSAQVDAIQAAGSQLDASLRKASGSPSATTLAAVGADVRGLGVAVRNLTTAVGNTC